VVQKAQGFLAEDGRFFSTEESCEAYEAQEALRRMLGELGIKDPHQAFGLINKCGDLILRYLNAIAALPEVDREPEEVEDVEQLDDDNIGEEDFGEPEEEFETVQPLPPGVRKPMPDLGRHIQPTQIRHERTINGPRGRKSNARDIRDGEDLATTSRRRPPKAR